MAWTANAKTDHLGQQCIGGLNLHDLRYEQHHGKNVEPPRRVLPDTMVKVRMDVFLDESVMDRTTTDLARYHFLASVAARNGFPLSGEVEVGTAKDRGKWWLFLKAGSTVYKCRPNVYEYETFRY